MTRKGFGKNHIKKEKIAILAASGFVLAALTMTGVYMKEQNQQELDDGYTIDFDALEESVENKNQEIAKNLENENLSDQARVEEEDTVSEVKVPSKEKEETNTGKGKQEAVQKELQGSEVSENTESAQSVPQQAEVTGEEALEAGADQIINGPVLSYDVEQGLVRPLVGEVLMPFSMESSIYFKTLDQYKYNPAMLLSAEVGTSVLACADGQVVNIFDSRETGKTMVVDMGDGYTMTYGQLKDVCVTVGSYVTAGSMIGRVAEPSIYYTLEGTNLYLLLEKDGEPINPEPLFQ